MGTLFGISVIVTHTTPFVYIFNPSLPFLPFLLFFLFLNSSHPFGGVDHSSLNASFPLLVILVIRNALLCLISRFTTKRKILHLF